MGAYDIFLSYHSPDRESVHTVRQLLEARGIATFFDREDLVAGLPWPHALEDALRSVRAVAVFLGPNGLGLWQKREMGFALDRQVQEESAGHPFPVIPVLLPGADPVPGFLFLNTWVDLRRDLTDPEALDGLVLSVRGETARASAEWAAVCPYRGLRAFDEEHAAFFFGQKFKGKDFADRLLGAALSRNLVAVVGPSGSGKSSEVHAGLLPLLRRQRPPALTWDAVSFTPGAQPFHHLAAALIPLLEPALDETDRLKQAQKLGGALAGGEVHVDAAIERLVSKSAGTDRLLVVVDQFEELFTQTPESERRPFVDAVLAALDRAPLTLMLTLRADFYGHAIALSRELSDRIEQRVVNLGPMRRKELERAIVEPARRAGLAFEPGLAERILDDVGKEPGNLPLLEFALTELWMRRQQQVRPLTHAAYEEIGGMAGAIAQRAEAEFAKFTPERQAIARRIFTRLVRVAQPDEGTEDTRQRATLAELSLRPQPGEAAEVGAVVQALTGWESRLLVTGRDQATGEETVEVAHEALIHHWARLQTWLDEDREFLLWRQRLRGALANWERTSQDEGSLLRGGLLAEAERWLTERPDGLNPDERDYIQESIALRMREAEAEQERQRHELAHAQALAEEHKQRAEEQARAAKSLRRRAVGLVVATLLAVMGGVSALILQERAWRDRFYREKNMGYFPKVSNPLGASLHLFYRVGETGIKEIEGFDGNGIYLEAGDYYLQARKENWTLKYPVYIQGYDRKAKPVVVQLPITLSIPQDMAYIPEGWFRMGDKEGWGYANERPSHDVYVDAFMMDIREVSNPAYIKFVEQGDYQEKEHWTQEGWEWKERLPEGAIASVRRQYWDDGKYIAAEGPIVGVTWYEASAYCQWVGKRLPTEAEWEKAARGPEGYRYAFGNVDDPSRMASEQPNSYGLYNMTGGVWEWVFDRYDENYYRSSPEKNPRGPDRGDRRIVRGASSSASGALKRTAFRWDHPPDYRSKTAGFRCVKGHNTDPH
jgi:formylglycine-generating enzyme required for sulfatase activity